LQENQRLAKKYKDSSMISFDFLVVIDIHFANNK